MIRGREVGRCAVAVPRLVPTPTGSGVALVAGLEALQVPVLNGSAALAATLHKPTQLLRLVAAGVPVPATLVGGGHGAAQAAHRRLGDLLVGKLPSGFGGTGVALLRGEEAARAYVEATEERGESILQRFVDEAGGTSVRVVVVGGTVVAACERRSMGGEFRASVHQGAETRAVVLSPRDAELAVAAAAALGLDVAGVDLISDGRETLVLEVNASPGLRGIEAATGIDVAGAIARLALLRAGLAPAASRDADQPR